LNLTAADRARRESLLVIVCCILLGGCRTEQAARAPSIEFRRVPQVDEGGTEKLGTVEGRAPGARAGQQVVLFARSGAWYVQPFIDRPFTEIQPDSTWKNSTHLGTEYAALLVDPGYRPPTKLETLPAPGDGVVAVSVVSGEFKLLVPAFWQTWWFRGCGGLAIAFMLLAFHRLRMRQMSWRLNARFEERLEERMRIAQELHDTLLQGFLSASMQLHVAVEGLPEESAERGRLRRVQQLMSAVIEEGRNTVQGLRSITMDSLDLEQAFSHAQREFANRGQIGPRIKFQLTVKGRPRDLHPIIRDEVYRIGLEALAQSFHRTGVKNVEVELSYSLGRLRVLVRDDGEAPGPPSGRPGRGEGEKLSGMRERAERIGARVKERSRSVKGAEIELSVPGRVAFLPRPSTGPLKWLGKLSPSGSTARLRKPNTKGEK
jgi:signal transduction histidine kinase